MVFVGVILPVPYRKQEGLGESFANIESIFEKCKIETEKRIRITS